MDECEELLPIDDSVWEEIENDFHNNSEAMLDDSFSAVVPEGTVPVSNVVSSTPVATRSRGRSARAPPPVDVRPSTPTMPSVFASDSGSPAASTRSRTRGATPTRLDSPRTRSMTRAATPTRNETRGTESDRPSSPALSTRSRARAPAVTSTPSRSNRPAQPQAAPPPKEAPVARIKCPECTSTFANDATYKIHKRMHLMKRVFTKIANPEMFMEKLPSLIMDTLEKIIKEKFVGKYADSLKAYAEELLKTFSSPEEDHDLLYKYLHEHLYAILSDHSSVFASALVYEYYVGVNSLLNNADFKTYLKKHVLSLGDVECPSVEVLELFIGNFMLGLTNETLIYFVRTIHGATANDEIRRKRSGDKSDSRTFLELCHYIGGSVVHTLIFKGNKFKDTNHSWNLFLDVVLKKFLPVEGVGSACSSSASHFTKSVDRGGLKDISQEALDFFVVLFDMLMSLEGPDGSLPNDVIEENVLQDSSILCLWDVLVGSHLDDDTVSLDFLTQICNTCKKIVMKGILKRRLNERLKKAYSAVSLRSRLAE